MAIVDLGAPELAALLAAELPGAWSGATRGLGSLTITSREAADIAIFAVPVSYRAPGSSPAPAQFIEYDDGAAEILVRDLLGLSATEAQVLFGTTNPVEVLDPASARTAVILNALHELAHIWCCHGPETGGHGHWAEGDSDELMDDGPRRWRCTRTPVCSAVVTAFSDRELEAMGLGY